MERKTNQLTFLDNVTHELGGKRTAAFFAKCDQYIPWEALAEPLGDMYHNDTSQGGASNWPVVLMIKCMMLQKWFNLSDPMLEEMLSDRLSFRRFVGLTMNDKTPDETTFVTFRKRLRKHGHSATDTNGMIKDYRFDTAKVHDSQHIDDLTVDEQHSVFADSAYMSADRKENLESRGIFCGIIQRRVRGQKELTSE